MTSAAKAVELVRAGRAEALMKGSLHTDELMGAVVARESGIRTARRISHCFIMDVPGHPDPLIITDAAVNIAPDLEDEGRHRPERDRSRACDGRREVRVAISQRDGDRQRRRCPPRSKPRRCARWPSAGRSPARCSTARSRSTTRSAPRRRRSRRSSRRLRGARTCSSFPTSKPATCWPRACRFSPAPTPPASCSARACRSS